MVYVDVCLNLGSRRLLRNAVMESDQIQMATAAVKAPHFGAPLRTRRLRSTRTTVRLVNTSEPRQCLEFKLKSLVCDGDDLHKRQEKVTRSPKV